MRANNGWWPEHDRRLSGEKRVEYWRQTCGPTGVTMQNDSEIFYDEEKQSYMLTVFQRFAALTARHGAKFVVLFQPYSCRGLEGSFLEARRADIRTLLERYPNTVVFPEGMLELWPAEKFVTAEHVRVGYDAENFRRVGKLLARVFAVKARADAVGEERGESIHDELLPTISGWARAGAEVAREEEPARAHRLIESPGAAPHRVDTRITGLSPGRTLVLSF